MFRHIQLREAVFGIKSLFSFVLHCSLINPRHTSTAKVTVLCLGDCLSTTRWLVSDINNKNFSVCARHSGKLFNNFSVTSTRKLKLQFCQVAVFELEKMTQLLTTTWPSPSISGAHVYVLVITPVRGMLLVYKPKGGGL